MVSGAALSLLLVFRTNSAYARVYDARCIWGQLTNTIRFHQTHAPSSQLL